MARYIKSRAELKGLQEKVVRSRKNAEAVLRKTGVDRLMEGFFEIDAAISAGAKLRAGGATLSDTGIDLQESASLRAGGARLGSDGIEVTGAATVRAKVGETTAVQMSGDGIDLTGVATLRAGENTKLGNDGISLAANPGGAAQQTDYLAGSKITPLDADWAHVGLFDNTADASERGWTMRANGGSGMEGKVAIFAATNANLAWNDPRNARLQLKSSPAGGIGEAIFDNRLLMRGPLVLDGAYEFNQTGTPFKLSNTGNLSARRFEPDYIVVSQNIAAGGANNFTHGLGTIPDSVQAYRDMGSGNWRPIPPAGTGTDVRIDWVSDNAVRIENAAATAQTIKMYVYR